MACSYTHSDDDDGEDDLKNEVLGIETLLRGLNVGPKKKLLVIHLDGLLAHSFFTYSSSAPTVRGRRPDGRRGKKLVFKRPYCDSFIEYCFDNFEVGVWASAKEWYVEGTISVVMGKYQKKLLFLWDQSHCREIDLNTIENDGKPVFLKELKKLWNKEYSSLPWPKGRYTQANTLFIDGSSYRALLNPPNTGIFLKPYNAENIKDEEIAPRSGLRAYLDGVAAAEDVPSYVKSHPYGETPVTPTHPDWEYYAKSAAVREYYAAGAHTEEKNEKKILNIVF